MIVNAHVVFVTLHALAGLVAFAAGCVAVRRPSWLPVYCAALVGLVAFLAAAVAVDWTTLDPPVRVLFVAFLGLGGYLLWHAGQARRLARAASLPTRRYLDHIGFTLVALFDGFVVIAVLDLGTPGWLAGVLGGLVAVAGHFVIGAAKARLPAPRRTGTAVVS